MIPRRTKRLGICLCVAVTSACASFRAQEQRPTSWPPAHAERHSLHLTVAMDASVDGRAHPISPAQLEKVSSHTENVYRESGLFASVQVAQGEAANALVGDDLVADLRVKYTSTATFGWTLLTYVTFFAVPSAYESALAATTTFRNGRGEVLGTVEKTATITTWEHVLLLPVSFFTFPIPVYWRVFDDLNRVTLEEAHRRGLF